MTLIILHLSHIGRGGYMENTAGIIKLVKKDENENIIDQQETYNKEFMDAVVQTIMKLVDEKIATLVESLNKKE